ncbi:MAG TPA: CPBP family intramembrane glutamic endopeptidase [Candidatus Eremiobacteraceae bacterium]|nr:CPBP family intramembrane glutamic endopeptidase [Candidatus Eremiobacteraceae bacterium]
MAQDHLTSSDKRTLLLWMVFAVIGALFAQKYFFRAFPEAAVDFKVSRAEAQSRARKFVEGMGENLSGYQSTIVFDVDENGKTYLEREAGLKQANQLMSHELNIWYWDVRFFRPRQEEEFLVRVSPAGKIVGYDHKVPETWAAQSLDRKEAEERATAFLQSKLGIDLNPWEFLPAEANSRTRPNRVDWSFTWQLKTFKVKDAPYRLQVGVQGNRIGDNQQFLQVPEAWIRSYEHLRSTNSLYEEIALVPYGFLLGAALWLGILLWRQGKTTWAAALWIGAVVTVLYYLMELNDWGSVRASYDTQYTYASFVLQRLFLLLLAAVGTAFTISLVYPAAEPLYRGSHPDKMRLPRAFTLRGMRSKEFFCATVVGISLAAIHIGFIVAFYLVGNRFGVWAPQDINFSDIVNTPFPWIAGVAIGILAATNEEFTFRLFAIPFLHKLTGSRVLSIILPAFFWSFLHSNYPQEPGYIRGIEIGIMGMAAGLVMLRWGIVATLIWHYTVDASLVGLLLIRSDNWYFKISGLVVALAAVAPLAYCGVMYLRRGRFEDVDELLNQREPAPEITLTREAPVEPVAVAGARYDALATGTLGFLAVCVLVAGFLAVKLKREHIGDYLKVSADRSIAMQRADAVIQGQGLNPRHYRTAAVMVDTTDPVANEFLWRRMSVAQINEIYAQRIPGALWRVRYFRDAEPEEFAVTLKADGSFHGFWHRLPEAAKGASLTKEEATAIAEKYLQNTKRIDLNGWTLVEANSDKRPNRTDTTLVWQQNTPLDPAKSGESSTDHAYARMSVRVLGDQPVDYKNPEERSSTFIKIPTEFEREMGEETVGRILVRVFQICLGLGLFIVVLVFFFKRLRGLAVIRIPWRRFFGWSLVGLLAAGVSFFLGRGIPALLESYPTSIPLRIFFGTAGIGLFLFGALLLGLLTVVFGLAWSLAARAFGIEHLPGWLGMPADYYRDAFWIGAGGTGLLAGLRHLLDYAASWWPTLHREIPASFWPSYDAVVPGGGVIGAGVFRALLTVGIILVGAGFIGAEVRVRWLRLALFFAVAAGLVSSWGSPADYGKQFLFSVIMLYVVVFGMRGVVRFNLLGLFLVVACSSLLGGAAELVAQPNTFYRANGYAVLVALAGVLAWPVVMWRVRRPGGRVADGRPSGEVRAS